MLDNAIVLLVRVREIVATLSGQDAPHKTRLASGRLSMIPKSGIRFSDKIMLKKTV
jgi:hypothetical protein